MATTGKSEQYNKLFQRQQMVIRALKAERCTADLAGRLRVKGLIGDRVYSEATNYGPNVVEEDRLRPILDAVLGKIELNPQKYDEFINVLKEIEGLEDIVDVIEEPLPKTTPPGLRPRRPVKEPASNSDEGQEPVPRPETKMNNGSKWLQWVIPLSLCVVIAAVVIVKYWPLMSPSNIPPEKQPAIPEDKESIWTQPASSAKELPLQQEFHTQKDGLPPSSGKPAEGFSSSFLSKKPTMKELQLIKWDGDEKLMLIETIAAHWRKLGTTLGIQENVLNGYATKHMKDQEECCREVLHRWLERGSEPKEAYPVNWGGLINALEDTGLGVIADDMRQMISKYTRSESVKPNNKPIPIVPETKHTSTTRLSAEDFAVFPEPTLLQLNRFLSAEVAARWEEIGEALGVKQGVLDSIRSNNVGYSNQQERCLREVFKKWYNGMTSEFSWKTIVEILQSMDEHKVVENLYRNLKEN